MRDITEGHALDFCNHLREEGKAENTIRRSVGRARQFFADVIKRELLERNPFVGIPATLKATPERFHFITVEEAEKVLNACPNMEWRLIFALARFGGIRVPSELLPLTWNDVLWDEGKLLIRSPKTEHYDHGAQRMIPIFPELRPHLMASFEEAEPGSQYLVTRYRDQSTNLRTQLHRIIKRAGLKPWPKTFQNLRASCETALAENFPIHVVCSWIGNSRAVAVKHYLQVTDGHYRKALEKDEIGANEKATQSDVKRRTKATHKSDAEHVGNATK
jgi:integrase